MLIGVGLVLLLVVITGAIGVPYTADEVRTAFLYRKKFWTARFYASAAWTFSDSGATNITALGTAMVAILASSATLSALFPGIDLNPFIIVNIACGAIVVAAPLLFGIANVVITRHSPVAPVDAMVTTQADTIISVPSGASIMVPGGALIRTVGGQVRARVNPGGTIPVPPGGSLTVAAGGMMSLPSGTAVAIGPIALLTMGTSTCIAAGDLAPPQPQPAGCRPLLFTRPAAAPNPQVSAGEQITVTTGAIMTITGAADIFFRAGTTMTALGGRAMRLGADTTITVPSSSNVMVAGMGSLLPAAALTMFGIGTEIGLIAVLAVHYSRATHSGQIAAGIISAGVAAGLALYGATAIRALADPTPGSSLNAEARSSFIL
jgi:hypothetical protein